MNRLEKSHGHRPVAPPARRVPEARCRREGRGIEGRTTTGALDAGRLGDHLSGGVHEEPELDGAAHALEKQGGRVFHDRLAQGHRG